MIEHRRDGVDLGYSASMQARVVEYRLGWWSRLVVALTGRVRVWGTP